MKRNLLLLLLAMVSGWLLAACNDGEDGIKPVDTVRVGDRVPAFQVTLHDGTTFDSRTLEGKVTVITFFNTTCGDCRRFLPQLEAAYRQVKTAAAPLAQTRFVAISRAQNDADVTHYWTAQQFTVPYSAQGDRAIYRLFAQAVIPRVYVINREGKVTAAFNDVDTPDVTKLQAAIAAAWQ